MSRFVKIVLDVCSLIQNILLSERCQREQKCAFWVFHKPIGTCYLQAWKVTTLKDGEYISGPKYCDCYEENKKHIGFNFDLTITPTLEDCR